MRVFTKRLHINAMQSLEPIAFEYLGDGCTGVTLVSEGAECVLINRAFFVKHITDAYMKFLRATVSTSRKLRTVLISLGSLFNWMQYPLVKYTVIILSS